MHPPSNARSHAAVCVLRSTVAVEDYPALRQFVDKVRAVQESALVLVKKDAGSLSPR